MKHVGTQRWNDRKIRPHRRCRGVLCVCDPEAAAIAISLINRKKRPLHGLTKVKNKTLQIGFIVFLGEPTHATVSKQFRCARLSSRSNHYIETVDVWITTFSCECFTRWHWWYLIGLVLSLRFEIEPIRRHWPTKASSEDCAPLVLMFYYHVLPHTLWSFWMCAYNTTIFRHTHRSDWPHIHTYPIFKKRT